MESTSESETSCSGAESKITMSNASLSFVTTSSNFFEDSSSSGFGGTVPAGRIWIPAFSWWIRHWLICACPATRSASPGALGSRPISFAILGRRMSASMRRTFFTCPSAQARL